jgi:hypothetical protein
MVACAVRNRTPGRPCRARSKMPQPPRACAAGLSKGAASQLKAKNNTRCTIRCAAVPLCRCAAVPLCRCAAVPLCRCAAVPLCRCAAVPLCRCAAVPLCRNPQSTCVKWQWFSSPFILRYSRWLLYTLRRPCRFDRRHDLVLELGAELDVPPLGLSRQADQHLAFAICL